jgi:hypothetical protein
MVIICFVLPCTLHSNSLHAISVNFENKAERVNDFSGENGSLLILCTQIDLSEWETGLLNNIMLQRWTGP